MSAVSDGVYEETYRLERFFPPRLCSPAACNGRKLENVVEHHHIREPGDASLGRFSTTGPTTSTYNSRRTSITFISFSSGSVTLLTVLQSTFAKGRTFSILVPSRTCAGGCWCAMIIASNDIMLAMRTITGPSRAAS